MPTRKINCEVRLALRCGIEEVIAFVPTREYVQDLVVGQDVLDAFGDLRPVDHIFARGVAIDGRAYVCFYTKHGDNGMLSQSFKEDELVRTLHLCCRFSSAELDKLERDMAIENHAPAVLVLA